MRVSSVAGRGLFAKNPIKAGSVIISLRPHSFALASQYLDSHCSACAAAPNSGLLRCTGCRTVWYCNATCQKNDWLLHRLECSALVNWAKSAPSKSLSVPSDAVRCLGRILWQKERKGFDSSWSKEIDALQSHLHSLQPRVVENNTHLAHSLVRYLGLSSPGELSKFGISSAGDLTDLISRFVTNTFALTSPSLTPVGVSVSPLVALFNHSCDPDAVIVFPRSSQNSAEEPRMQVIALKNISPHEEILTSYIDTTLPRSLRQAALQDTYDFICQCKLCHDDKKVDPRESVWCPTSCGGMCPAPSDGKIFQCAKCHTVVPAPESIADALRIGQEALEKASSIQVTNHVKALQLTTNIIPILVSAGLTPSCHPLLALTGLHKTLLLSSFSEDMSQELLDETIRTAAKHCVGLSTLLLDGHPVRAVALAELGKLLAVDEPSPATSLAANVAFPPSGPPRLKAAYETLVRARNEVMIGFGRDNDGGELGRNIRETLVSLEKELGVWTQGIHNALQDLPKPMKMNNKGC
ncbi:SET domain-containing protein [Rhizopogon vinicolor AM-OR11-026]|uniref:SET domain-containing protein n=1 Tax=Rhizopogon vinicolor AM-OR11-026 TaxID=1314800 RepID=A0A1B7N6G1_9AGAM|nr:SET domain-containing protein [Rhizopogon vinicolor AM-OR11-026]